MQTNRHPLPTVRSRELGNELRTVLRDAGIGARQLARRLDWGHPQISHLLSGNRLVTDADLASVLVACGVDYAARQRFLQFNRGLGDPDWLQQHDPPPRVGEHALRNLERDATTITCLQLSVIPVLLQTEGYALAAFDHGAGVAGSGREALVSARLARQRIFSEHRRPRTAFFLAEAALRASAGDAAVMSDQLHHVLRMAVRSSVTVRIIRDSCGVHAGQVGSFTVLESHKFAPVVHVETEAFSVFLEQRPQVETYQRVLAEVDSIALGEDESKHLISAMAAEVCTADVDFRDNGVVAEAAR